MEVLFESKVAVVTYDERGFVECIVNEGQDLDLNDAIAIHDVIEARNTGEFRLLINRLHSYSTAQSLLLLHSREGQADVFRLKPKRVAYLVYQPITEMIADFAGDLVFKRPHEVFQDREQAINWLLSD